MICIAPPTGSVVPMKIVPATVMAPPEAPEATVSSAASPDSTADIPESDKGISATNSKDAKIGGDLLGKVQADPVLCARADELTPREALGLLFQPASA